MASFSVARGARLFPLGIVSAAAICLIFAEGFFARVGLDAGSSLAALSAAHRSSSHRTVSTDGTRARRILYLEGAPRPEMKFIQRAMSDVADPRVVLLQRTRDDKYMRMNVDGPDELRDGFPRSSEELFAYRGLILGPIEASAFTPEQHQMIADFVGVRGGGVLVLGGEQSLGEGGWADTPLAHVLPIVIESRAASTPAAPEQLHVRPTPEGMNHPASRIADNANEATRLWQELPAVTTVNGVHPTSGGVTLLTAADGNGRDRIVLAVQSQGRGKTAVFTVQDSWHWVMSGKVDSPVHERFWRSLLTWLVDGVPE